jgi:hypothetical protein
MSEFMYGFNGLMFNPLSLSGDDDLKNCCHHQQHQQWKSSQRKPSAIDVKPK